MQNQHTRTIPLGVILIIFGLFWWLNLWWLAVPAALVTAGVGGYIQRRAMGRTIEAVQLLIWGAGLGALWVTDFIWPGILLLAGASLLLRGREFRVDETLQTVARRVRRPRISTRPAAAPIMTTSGEFEQPVQTPEPSHWQR